MSTEASLPLVLKQLCLPTFLSQWQRAAADAIEQHWTYPQYLATLGDLEAASRKQKRIARHLYEAKLPPGKSLDCFDFKHAPTVNAAQIQALAQDSGWVERAENILLFGPSGVGKTHLACAIAHRLIEQGVRVLFTKTTSLVQKLQQSRQECKLPDALKKLSKYDVLILDDIGYVKKGEAETSVLFDLIDDRYESKSLIITSNHSFEEWDKIFPNGVMTVAAVDRLVHHATVIKVEAQSYRKKGFSERNGAAVTEASKSQAV